MNSSQFKDPLCYLCLHDTVVSSLSLMQEVVGLRLTFHKHFVNEGNHLGKNSIAVL